MRNSLLFLSPEVWFDDQTVHCQVDHQWPHGGVEDSTGEQLVRQVDREEVGLTGPVQPVGNTRTHRVCQVPRSSSGAQPLHASSKAELITSELDHI